MTPTYHVRGIYVSLATGSRPRIGSRDTYVPRTGQLRVTTACTADCRETRDTYVPREGELRVTLLAHPHPLPRRKLLRPHTRSSP